MKKFELLGFRSGKWYKMTIAIIYLILIGLFFIGTIVKTDELAITVQDKIVTKVYELTIWLAMFIPYLIMCNPFGIREILPLYKSPKSLPKIIACILTSFLLIISTGFINGLTTQEYQENIQIKEEYELLEKNKEERLEAEAKAEEVRLEAEAKAEEERLEAEAKAEKERLEAEAKAEEERLEAEAKAEEERLEAEAKAEEERLEAEAKAEEERLEAEAKAEEERLEAERLAITFDEIYIAYKENELRADDMYKNNRYRISATINGMSNDGLFNLTGGATLTMETRVGNTIVFFFAEFEKNQEENLKKVNVGDTITFDGECLSDQSWVNCELILD